jgi:hypothetical protein
MSSACSIAGTDLIRDNGILKNDAISPDGGLAASQGIWGFAPREFTRS